MSVKLDQIYYFFFLFRKVSIKVDHFIWSGWLCFAWITTTDFLYYAYVSHHGANKLLPNTGSVIYDVLFTFIRMIKRYKAMHRPQCIIGFLMKKKSKINFPWPPKIWIISRNWNSIIEVIPSSTKKMIEIRKKW